MFCWKLVRDKLAKELAKRPGIVVKRVVDREELDYLLRVKVLEEALELLEKGDIEEVADILEAINALLKLRGVEWSQVEEIMARKREERGGFEEGWLVIFEDCNQQ